MRKRLASLAVTVALLTAPIPRATAAGWALAGSGVLQGGLGVYTIVVASANGTVAMAGSGQLLFGVLGTGYLRRVEVRPNGDRAACVYVESSQTTTVEYLFVDRVDGSDEYGAQGFTTEPPLVPCSSFSPSPLLAGGFEIEPY